MADYYFDGTNGSDTTGAGTEANPYQSIKIATVGGVFNPSNARFFIKRGTTVLVAAEIHPNGSFYIGPYGSGDELPEVVYNSGGSYFLATGTGAVSTDDIVFDSIAFTDAVASSSAACYQNNAGSGRMIVKDCVITGFLNAVMPQRGTGHQILRNVIKQFSNCGIIIEHTSVAAPSNMLIEGNYIDSRNAAGTSSATNDAITLHAGASAGYGNVVRNNVCIAGTEQGIDIASTFQGTLVEDNIVYATPTGTNTSWSDIYCAGANSIIRNNLVFSKYRIGIYLDAANIKVIGNTVIGTDGLAGSVLIYCYTGAVNPFIVNNHIVMPTGFTAAGMLVAGGLTSGTVKNNIFINYSASSSSRFISTGTISDLYTWSINNNYYVQIAGSYATPWAQNRTFTSWKALTGSPDSNGVSAVTPPLSIPSFQIVGQDFNLDKLYQIAEENPLVEAGAHVGYIKDLANHQFWNPPSIGPVEYTRERARPA